jgi:hypothetical protein
MPTCIANTPSRSCPIIPDCREAEREASGTLRAAKPSRSLLERFEAEAEAAEAQIAEAREAAAAYAKELQDAQARLKEAEKALRR